MKAQERNKCTNSLDTLGLLTYSRALCNSVVAHGFLLLTSIEFSVIVI